MSDHARFQPSSAHRWIECHGSVKAQEGFPDVETEEAAEGTASHWAFAEMFAGREVKAGYGAENGVILTDEMIDGARQFFDDVTEVVGNGEGWEMLHIEERTDIDRIGSQNWGTPDAWCWNPYKKRLIVWDYKYGHRIVEAEKNWQMLNYTVGLLDQVFGGHMNGQDDQLLGIEHRVIQPRAYHPLGTSRSFKFEGVLMCNFTNQIKLAYEEGKKENPMTKAGPWCRDCKAAGNCDTLNKAASDIMEAVQVLSLSESTPHAVGVRLTHLERAGDIIGALTGNLKAQAESMIEQGHGVPGWAMGHGRGSTIWTKPKAEIFALGELMGVDLKKEPEPITPTQAKKKVDAAVINPYIKSVTGKRQLMQDSKTTAGRVFGKK